MFHVPMPLPEEDDLSGSDTTEEHFPGELRAVASTISMSSEEGEGQCPHVSSTRPGLIVGVPEAAVCPPKKPYVYVAASDESEEDDSQDTWGDTGKFLIIYRL